MKTLLLAAALMLSPLDAMACQGPVAVCDGAAKGHFALVDHGKPATVYVDAAAEKPILRVAQDFADDLERVSGTRPEVVHSLDGVTGDVVVIGEAGQVAGLADGKAIAGEWEAYQQSVVKLPGGHHALVIVGADKRGTIYGTYDISAKMGVSPWYWWADVPVEKKYNLEVMDGTRSDAPAVKYRGFFINDEDPAFGGWAKAKYGGVNHQVYAKIFELDLRLKGNFLWPAMWDKSIADDDPDSLTTADDYGIVLGTSHHEPMTRAQAEWHRHTEEGVTGGAWDYTKNAENLRKFWRGGIERMVQGHHEDVVTVGMRGDGDEPMTEGTATQLLETIVADQRQIIADVTGKPADQTPQVWALYKEVQAYYDHGMKVPDDVTLLFSDDNWGNIRRLPKPGAAPRTGGYGVYYHFDYVGGPRNYKWINTNQIEKTWQQMDLAYGSGADRLWIVNVGDIKPMEYPLSFFMDMAWNPKAMTPEALQVYPAQWGAQQFGDGEAPAMARLLPRYSQMAAFRKPELVNASAFDTATLDVLKDRAAAIAGDANKMRARLSPAQQPAFDELIGYEASALANLYDLYDKVAWNRDLAARHDARANAFADAARADFAKDASLAAAYNGLLGGKWNHMMDQTHIGYTTWQQPDSNVMPELASVNGTPGKVAAEPAATPVLTVNDRKGRFADVDGHIAINAYAFTWQQAAPGVEWRVIPYLGHETSGVVSMPQTAPAGDPDAPGAMQLNYAISLKEPGDYVLSLELAPTLDVRGQGGLRIAVGIDNGTPVPLVFNLDPENKASGWVKAVSDNLVTLQTVFPGLKAGPHTIKIYRVDGNVVLERLKLDGEGRPPQPEVFSAPGL